MKANSKRIVMGKVSMGNEENYCSIIRQKRSLRGFDSSVYLQGRINAILKFLQRGSPH